MNIVNPQQRYVDYLPYFPRCSDNLKSTTKSLCSRPRELALKYSWIQHNPTSQVANLVFDIDEPGFHYWEDQNLCPPNLIIKNINNAHCQYVYLLEFPVLKSNFKATRFLNSVQNSYTQRLSADSNFTGFISKNPLSNSWDTTVISRNLVDLDRLASFLPSNNNMFKRIEDRGEGRNVRLFDLLRHWAYSHYLDARLASFDIWHRQVFMQCENYAKSEFTSHPIPYSEIKSVAKSVAKYVYYDYDPNHKNKAKGVMCLPAEMDQREKEVLGAKYAAEQKKSNTLDKLKASKTKLSSIGIIPTQKALSIDTNISISTVKRHWKNI